MILKGNVYRVGDNINTDVIMPGRWCHLTDDA
ncbi:MAG: 3-isopropylmalate dehydratase small subunit, partial [candidate division Zixibacteria bacterium]|nr:3-isopropylmalate dehydratase small subunit [candidate division Zixibacteria bacterium]